MKRVRRGDVFRFKGFSWSGKAPVSALRDSFLRRAKQSGVDVRGMSARQHQNRLSIGGFGVRVYSEPHMITMTGDGDALYRTAQQYARAGKFKASGQSRYWGRLYADAHGNKLAINSRRNEVAFGIGGPVRVKASVRKGKRVKAHTRKGRR